MYKKEIFLEIDANLHQPIQSMEADSNSRAIRFYLTSNYAPLNLKDKKVIFKAVKPDSTDIVNDCEIIDVEKGIVETKVTKQLNAVPGRVNCQLSIIGANDYVLKTKKFGILVDSKLTESGIISSREYKTLENALSEVHEINKNFEQVNAKINEVATKGTTVEVIEEVTKEEIERQIADGTITHLMIEDGSVTPEKTSFYDEIATQKNLLKNAEFDYMGNNQNTVKKAIDSSIDWVLGEVNTAHHEGQHITATDTIEGHAKSAILKGQTLVNLRTYAKCQSVNVQNVLDSDGMLTWDTYDAWGKVGYIVQGKPNTTYYIQYSDKQENLYLFVRFVDGLTGTTQPITWLTSTRGKFTTNETGIFTLTAEQSEATSGSWIKDFMIIEYQEGMENWNIPYFEGMQSVKMPVLTTTGKNLAHIQPKDGIGYSENGITVSFNSDKQTILVNGTCNADNTVFYFKDVNIELEEGDVVRGFAECLQGVGGKISFRTNTDEWTASLSTYIERGGITGSGMYTARSSCTMNGHGIRIDSGESFDNAEYRWIVVKNETNTSYEPYKSNILRTSEEVTLRGIGEVKDELDCLTGEVTERIGEVVLNGSEKITLRNETLENTLLFVTHLTNINIKSDLIYSDKFDGTDISWDAIVNADKEFIRLYTNDTNALYIRILKSKLATQDVNGFKQWLSKNPITIQYKLATESIKTVDLSDNHVYSYKGTTHYDCSSAEGSLVPTLSIDVPTNLPAVVTRQRVTIQELEKENVALKNEIEETANSSVNGDLELMSSQFELDFRLFEIEMNLDMPMMAMMRGVKSMAMTVYQQAKTLILAGKYEREDMEYKLNRYEAAGRITVEEYEELIALMDARELVD